MANNSSVNEGSNETIRWAGRPTVRPSDRQEARTRTANRRRRSTIPPAREPPGGANEDVSWLRAIQLAFPGYPSGNEPITAARYSGGAAPGVHPPPLTPSPTGNYTRLNAGRLRRTS